MDDVRENIRKAYKNLTAAELRDLRSRDADELQRWMEQHLPPGAYDDYLKANLQEIQHDVDAELQRRGSG
jgi:hypothetical protein